MQVQRKRPVRRTKSQWAEILRRFEASGLGPSKFCRREGLTLSNMHRWRRRIVRKPAADFVEIVPLPTAAATQTSWELDVKLPNGVCLQFRG